MQPPDATDRALDIARKDPALPEATAREMAEAMSGLGEAYQGFRDEHGVPFAERPQPQEGNTMPTPEEIVGELSDARLQWVLEMTVWAAGEVAEDAYTKQAQMIYAAANRERSERCRLDELFPELADGMRAAMEAVVKEQAHA